MLTTIKTALKVVFVHSAKTEEGRVGEKLDHETQASERKTTRKTSLLSSKFFRTLNNSGERVDEAGPL